MEILLGLGIAGFVLASLILPWVQRAELDQLSNDMNQLRQQLHALLLQQEKDKEAKKPEKAIAPVVSAAVVSPAKPSPQAVHPAQASPPEAARKPVTAGEPLKPPPQKPSPLPSRPPEEKISFEQQFGARLPVWIGGIALAMAGLFMVKYSIESGLLSPAVRLALGELFGIGLLGAGHWMRGNSNVANDKRIAQALSGAGIAVLYACLLAATSLYHMLPPLAGFIGMAMVTAMAVTLSLRHGPPIALLGLTGGFLTPALIGSGNPNAPLLFLYLYFVSAGLFFLIRRQNWWWLAIPTIIGGFLWILLWLGTHFQPADGLWLGLFIIAICSTIIASSKQAMEEGRIDTSGNTGLAAMLNYFSLGGGVILMGIVAVKADFGLTEWGLFGLLTAGGIALGYFNQKLYGFVPFLSLAVSIALLIVWHGPDLTTFAWIVTAFAVLNAAGGHTLLWRTDKPLPWAMLACAASLAYYLLAYARLHDWVMAGHAGMPVWGMLALLLALIAVYNVSRIIGHYDGNAVTRQRLLAIFSATATAFVSLGLAIELDREFLPVAFAAEVLAISWLNTRFDIEALRKLAAVLAGVFGLLMLPHILSVLQLVLSSIAEVHPYSRGIALLAHMPLLHLGLPALMFVIASVLLRREKDDTLVDVLECAAITLVTLMGYCLLRQAFHTHDISLIAPAGFAERGVITNAIFLLGLGCFWLGRRFVRPAASLSALVLGALALLRVGYFDCLLHNPLWTHEAVGGVPVFNALLLPYGLPIVWLILANRELPYINRDIYLRYTGAAMLLLAFVFVSFNVRQFYHGEYLDSALTGYAEIYTYSAAWLLMGIGLLTIGTWRDDKAMRLASLAIMIISVGKVFLYDASELTGLYRVFSFLGLGFSLLGLSWFYTRFVFNRNKQS